MTLFEYSRHKVDTVSWRALLASVQFAVGYFFACKFSGASCIADVTIWDQETFTLAICLVFIWLLILVFRKF